jgi:GH15 family glucan-1,4-alpha-glucosidase
MGKPDSETPARSLRIEEYGMIGDCKTAALVGANGAVDWLCVPRFDSASCFASLLGDESHGHWLIAPKSSPTRVRRSYRDATLILETVFTTPDGEVALIDAMPLGLQGSHVIRRVEGRRGTVAMHMHLTIRFDYGTATPWVTGDDTGTGLLAVAGPDQLTVRGPVPIKGKGFASIAEFEVSTGESLTFVMSHGPSNLPAPDRFDGDEALADTEKAWRDWASRCTYEGPSREAVLRSLITLKALTDEDTGGIVASPTTSLPEFIGGTRNWDYRYCWLRDATLTLIALMGCGYYDEAAAWRDWLHRSIAGSADELQIMYGVGGERRLLEWEAEWLTGYEGSRPVRIGNAASGQIQLDVYGEVMDALHLARVGGLATPDSAWAMQVNMVEHLENIWQEPDDGIWEVRGGRQHFVHSKVMAWVAIDRALQDMEQYKLPGPYDRWSALRSTMHAEICEKGFNTARNSFVQSYGSQELDASLLILPLVGFLPCDDPRIQGTVAAIERDLVVDGFVLRYRTEAVADGLPPGEGVFLACSFWLCDNYVLQGRLDEAQALFDRLLTLRNDLGLLSEEFDPRLQRQLGNFPQAFSHLALVNSALDLRDGSGSTQRSQCSGEGAKA